MSMKTATACAGPPQIRPDFVKISKVSFKHPGSEATILRNVNLSLPERSLGLIYGKSGSGKTTLLQIVAGMSVPTQGSVAVGDGTTAELSNKVGLVFQFPERYFLTDSILHELSFGWPCASKGLLSQQVLAMRVQAAAFAVKTFSPVGLGSLSWNTDPRSLSDGYKRRLALAVQLVRMPEVLLLDEPLAGLDWQARLDLVKLLQRLKLERTLLVVSHDLRELMPLVDKAWQMNEDGSLLEKLPPPFS